MRRPATTGRKKENVPHRGESQSQGRVGGWEAWNDESWEESGCGCEGSGGGGRGRGNGKGKAGEEELRRVLNGVQGFRA